MKYLEDADLTLYQGDVREVLRSLPDESVHCVVTSPPYWGLRDYGTGAWEGGDAECDHLAYQQKRNAGAQPGSGSGAGGTTSLRDGPPPSVCKCGAHRIDNQLGLEPTPEQYVSNMVEVFREVRRVLRKDGTCWLNVGDSYAGSWGNYGARDGKQRPLNEKRYDRPGYDGHTSLPPTATVPGLKPKDLCMIPARLALALQADGWYLRSQIVWSKPNPMPESVTDRPTTSHEFVYLLTRSPRYYFDQEAVREAHKDPIRRGVDMRHASVVERGSWDSAREDARRVGKAKRADGEEWVRQYNPAGRNLRSVWEIPTQPYPEAHFATYPEELVRRCILAGTSERGCCPECGGPWARKLERYGETKNEDYEQESRSSVQQGGKASTTLNGVPASVQTLGWRPSCDCAPSKEPEGYSESYYGYTPTPCTVLDPFFGSGTTGLVARKHGRRTIGIELSPNYCELAARRLQQLSLLSEGA